MPCIHLLWLGIYLFDELLKINEIYSCMEHVIVSSVLGLEFEGGIRLELSRF